ncbi:MAG: DUF2784 domain-containing protein [Zoogloea sp.]|nr:DUF2784 domain-containing protein [Zoogloea sp.]
MTVLLKAAADIVVLLHFGFILFVMLGGLAVLNWHRLAWIHVPAVAWALLLEMFGWICPLTPLENLLRQAGGSTGYRDGFIEHYLMHLIYPAGLTRGIQLCLGLGVLAVNAAVYSILWRQSRKA